MMGQKVFQEKFFYNFSLSQRVPEDHILRRLSEVVDLSFVRTVTAPFYSHTGQPSIDPVVLFKMMLLGYLYGITSERKLAEECRLNLAFMWYLGYDLDEVTPDHSVISKARSRYGRETFERFFEHVLGLCVGAGLVKGDILFADSTLIRANASLKSVVPRTDAFQLLRTPREHVERVFEENPMPTEDGTVVVASEPTSSAEHQDMAAPQSLLLSLSMGEEAQQEETTAAPLERRPRGRPAKPRSTYNERYGSRTDPDASVVSRPYVPRAPYYKQHFTVDTSRVITAVTVTPAAVEDYMPVHHLLERQPVPPRRFCADSHYGVPRIYGELKQRGIVPAIPRRSSHTQKPRPGHLPVSAFRYDGAQDVYFCPQGKPLRRVAFEEKWQRYHYRPKQSDCRGCPLRKACATERTVRTIVRSIEEEAVEWALAHLQTPEAKRALRARSVYAEGVVGEAKVLHGLRRATCRGKEKVTIQALLTATVQNLKRLVRHQALQGAGALAQVSAWWRRLSRHLGIPASAGTWATAPISV